MLIRYKKPAYSHPGIPSALEPLLALSNCPLDQLVELCFALSVYPVACVGKLDELRLWHGGLEPEGVADAHKVVLVAGHDSHLGYLRRDAGQTLRLDMVR